MKKSIRIARITQLIGALFLIAFVVSCSQARETGEFGSVWLVIGVLLILGARIYEWLTNE